MAKKQQYISKIQHSKNNNWHIYDVQLFPDWTVFPVLKIWQLPKKAVQKL